MKNYVSSYPCPVCGSTTDYLKKAGFGVQLCKCSKAVGNVLLLSHDVEDDSYFFGFGGLFSGNYFSRDDVLEFVRDGHYFIHPNSVDWGDDVLIRRLVVHNATLFMALITERFVLDNDLKDAWDAL